MEDGGDDDILGPGTDLAFSFSGMLMVVTILAVVQLWSMSQNLLKIPKLENELTAEKAQTVALGGENKELRGKLGEAIWKLKELGDFGGDVHAANSDLRRKLDETSKDLETVRTLNAKLKKENETLRAALAGADDLARKLAEVSGQLKGARADIASLKDEVSALKGQNAALSSALASEKAAHAATLSKHDDLLRRHGSLTSDFSSLKSENATVRHENVLLRYENADLKTKLNDRPPIITISDHDVHTFDTASARMSEALLRKLRIEIAPELVKLGTQYKARVIEVIGHTDEIKIKTSARQKCNLDEALLAVLNETAERADLIGCDNVGLGMARAVSVVMALKRLGLDRQFSIIPLSAGQAVDIGDTVPTGLEPADDRRRRRIEIRLRRTRE